MSSCAAITRGELRAVRSATLTAPNLFGTVQVTRHGTLGAFAREKDLVVEFDDSEVNSRLEEKQLEIEQIDEQIKKIASRPGDAQQPGPGGAAAARSTPCGAPSWR